MTITQLLPPLISIANTNSEQCEYKDASLINFTKIDERLLGCKEFQIDEFKFLDLLGVGAFGVVKAALHMRTRVTYAIKFLSKKEILKSAESVDAVCNEILLLKEFQDTKFLTSCVGICQDGDDFGIVQPLHGGGELFHLLDDEDHLPMECRLYVAAEILAGLEELHSRNCLYRDLKPENILFGNDLHVKLTDFGCAKKMKNSRERTMSMVGTADYTAPEMIAKDWYGKEADIWAFGVLLYELFCKMPPFNLAYTEPDQTTEKFQRIISGHLTFPCGCSPKLVDLCSKILVPDPAQRYTLQQIKEHAFFHCIDWDQVKSLQIPKEYLPRVHIDLDRPCSNFPQEDDDYLPYEGVNQHESLANQRGGSPMESSFSSDEDEENPFAFF